MSGRTPTGESGNSDTLLGTNATTTVLRYCVCEGLSDKQMFDSVVTFERIARLIHVWCQASIA